MLAVLDEVIAISIPELGRGVFVDGSFGQEDEELSKVGHMDIIPARITLADYGNVLRGEDEVGEFVGLAASGMGGTSSTS
jgi:hypothetical protein